MFINVFFTHNKHENTHIQKWGEQYISRIILLILTYMVHKLNSNHTLSHKIYYAKVYFVSKVFIGHVSTISATSHASDLSRQWSPRHMMSVKICFHISTLSLKPNSVSFTPRNPLNLWIFSIPNDFVKMLATWSSIVIYISPYNLLW